MLKHLVELSRRCEWKFAGGGWRAVSNELRLEGWTKKRRVVVLRRPLPEQSVGFESESPAGQKVLVGMAVLPESRRLFKYAVLVTSLPEEDLLEVAGRHTQAVTSRPVPVYGVAKRTTHGNRSRVTITRSRGKAEMIAKLLDNVNRFLLRSTAAAEQLSKNQRWTKLGRIILREFFPTRTQAPAPVLC